MSYILDALQRAHAQRDRQAVPGLHAPATPLPSFSTVAPARLRWPWAALLLGAVALLSWALWGLGSPTVALPRPTPTAPVAAQAPVPGDATTQLGATASPPAPAATPAPSPTLALRPATSLRVVTPAPVVAVAAADPQRIYALGELPESLRAQLPALVITGSSYSDQPAQRLLIVNGQMVQERASLGPDLVLEQIGQKTALLRFKGVRFRMGY